MDSPALAAFALPEVDDVLVGTPHRLVQAFLCLCPLVESLGLEFLVGLDGVQVSDTTPGDVVGGDLTGHLSRLRVDDTKRSRGRPAHWQLLIPCSESSGDRQACLAVCAVAQAE